MGRHHLRHGFGVALGRGCGVAVHGRSVCGGVHYLRYGAWTTRLAVVGLDPVRGFYDLCAPFDLRADNQHRLSQQVGPSEERGCGVAAHGTFVYGGVGRRSGVVWKDRLVVVGPGLHRGADDFCACAHDRDDDFYVPYVPYFLRLSFGSIFRT